MKLKMLGGIIFFALTLSQYSHAEVNKWQPVNPDNSRIIAEGQVEAKIRLYAILNAKRTIDLIDYDIDGEKDLDALLRAANQGVQVRFIRGGFISKVYQNLYRSPSLYDPVETFFNENPAATPIQRIFSGGWRMIKNGWSPLAGVHEKLLIIDGELAFVTGRGMSKMYMNFRDICTVFKGPLVHDSTDVFNNLWKIAHKQTSTPQPPTAAKDVTPQILIRSEPTLPEGALSSTERESFESLKEWVNTPAALPPTEAHPTYARILHHDLLRQIKRHCKGIPYYYNYSACSKAIQDPIVNELIRFTQEASRLRFYTLGLTLHPDLKKALLERLEEAKNFKKSGKGRDFQLEIYTNSANAYQVYVFYPLSTLAWKTSLPDMDDILRYAESGVNVHIYAFDKNSSPDSLEFLHQKGAMATYPDGTEYVVMGSHNANRSSSKINDEIAVEYKENANSAPIAFFHHQIFEESVRLNGLDLSPQDIKNQRWWTSLPLWGWESRFWKWGLVVAESLL